MKQSDLRSVAPSKPTVAAVLHQIRLAGLAVLLLAAGSGCRSLPGMLLSGAAGSMTQALYSQPDPELVRQGAPAFMLTLDGALAGDPENPALLLAATQAYSAYCQAFLSDEAAQPRAALLYDRAKDYSLRLLASNKRLAKGLRGSQDDWEAALKQCKKQDVPQLFAAGNAWLGWVLSHAESMEAISDMPKAMAVMRRVLELEPDYERGAVHTLFGIYYAAQPAAAGQDLPRSKQHFEAAIKAAGDGYILPTIAYAEFYGKATLDATFFATTLKRALAVDIAKCPERRLINAVARERALFLLAHQNDFF